MTHPYLTAPEVLALGIKSEANASDIYRLMAEKVQNSLVKEKLLKLADEEKRHQEILTQLYRKITGGEEPVLQRKGISEVKDFLEGEYSHEAALELAIRSEEEAEKFYTEAAKKSEDPNGRFMFEYLANFERGHKILLQNELNALRNNPHWFDEEGNLWDDGTIHIGP